MTQQTVIDTIGDGRLHIVAREGVAYLYLRDTDVPGQVNAPDWFTAAAKVSNWADGTGGKAAAAVRAACLANNYAYEALHIGKGTYALAIYPADITARRIVHHAVYG